LFTNKEKTKNLPAFFERSSLFLSSATASSKSACIAAIVDSSCRRCDDKLAFCVLISLIRSAASCNSFSAALRARSACSKAVRNSSSSPIMALARRSAVAAASRASSRCLCSSSICTCNSLIFS
jgi:hypothetical protein